MHIKFINAFVVCQISSLVKKKREGGVNPENLSHLYCSPSYLS